MIKLKLGPAERSGYVEDDVSYDLLAKEGKGPWKVIGTITGEKENTSFRAMLPKWRIAQYEAILFDQEEEFSVDVTGTPAEAKRALLDAILEHLA